MNAYQESDWKVGTYRVKFRLRKRELGRWKCLQKDGDAKTFLFSILYKTLLMTLSFLLGIAKPPTEWVNWDAASFSDSDDDEGAEQSSKYSGFLFYFILKRNCSKSSFISMLM